MEIIIFILIILIFVDIYYRLNQARRLGLISRHLLVVNNHYEKILLAKKIIGRDDIVFTRKIISNGISEKEYDELKRIVLALDSDYLNKLHKIFYDNMNKEQIEIKTSILKEKIYNRQFKILTKKEEIEEFNKEFNKILHKK
ncbi:hypothetical protein ACFLZ0_01220 [Patescibacteria group bacterium]